MLMGYARVSSGEQNLELKRDAMEVAGSERLFTDVASGSLVERPVSAIKQLDCESFA